VRDAWHSTELFIEGDQQTVAPLLCQSHMVAVGEGQAWHLDVEVEGRIVAPLVRQDDPWQGKKRLQRIPDGCPWSAICFSSVKTVSNTTVSAIRTTASPRSIAAIKAVARAE
jgi:hypothetical protein